MIAREFVPLALFALLAALLAVFGLCLLRRPRAAAALFADRDARRPFRAEDARAVGLVFAVVGVALLALGAARLVAILATA
ncbi:SsrA-binding protein [Leifsonia xyli subsp. cynodontis DSM 46306]|jgi:hypothetical protein|uniref:Uncharacterized protein n=1 Tax=Leifsonia xyli subsp. cynodontis DSM 46306 TaxID=1389489 RepID=U3P849_LEIXC|nr:hypothetical protein [Leifsonia xyli]AGW41981.1 SsrA-binding protein [Leifsonia xyli subsp. cynodontis DSM 46306]